MGTSISNLVVDDDPNILVATAPLLQNINFPVFQAEGGEEALRTLRQNWPELILLDVNLPDVSGIEICRRIKSDADLKQTFVVLLSGSMITSDNHSEGLERGADGISSDRSPTAICLPVFRPLPESLGLNENVIN